MTDENALTEARWADIFRNDSRFDERRIDYRSASDLALDIAAFANSAGGRIVVGADAAARTIEGVWVAKIRKFYDEALTSLEPRPTTRLEVQAHFSSRIVVIAVSPSPQLVLAKGGAWKRVKGRVVPMTATQIARILGVPESQLAALKMRPTTVESATATPSVEPKPKPDQSASEMLAPVAVNKHPRSIKHHEQDLRLSAAPTEGIRLVVFADAIASLTSEVFSLRKDLRDANSPRSKYKDYFVGGVIGAALGFVVQLGYTLLT